MNSEPITGREIVLTEAFAYNGQYEVKITGYRNTALAGVTTSLDFAVGAEDRYISGTHLLLVNHAEGDTVSFRAVDKDNILGYGPNVVLKSFAVNWNVDSTKSDQGRDVFNFVARLMAGLYIRIDYVSVGGADVIVKPNFILHKKLV